MRTEYHVRFLHERNLAVYFGVLFIVNNSIGLITPPVGVVLNVVAGVALWQT
jgi:TRAP-type C4-dicarboxylate transport system permease large subunit